MARSFHLDSHTDHHHVPRCTYPYCHEAPIGPVLCARCETWTTWGPNGRVSTHTCKPTTWWLKHYSK